MTVRPYTPADYMAVAELYRQGELYGGQFDEHRDSAERLRDRMARDPQSILVAEDRQKITGTLSLIEDGRVAWLYRFAARDMPTARQLFDYATMVLRSRGHQQVLVYTPAEANGHLQLRYEQLGFTKGNPYDCYWLSI